MTPSDPVKLQIEVFGEQSFDGEPDAIFEVLFNPSEYARTASNAYNQAQPPNASRPQTSFAHGNPDALTLSLMFDGTGAAGVTGPVVAKVTEFLELARYRGDDHAPPYLWLRWGGEDGGLSFRCYLKSATATFTLFDRDGQPIRAKVSASFEEVIDDRDRRAEESQASPDLHRVWTVQAGQSLDGIAHDAYGDVLLWREIARVNGLENPRALVAGAQLSLPPKER